MNNEEQKKYKRRTMLAGAFKDHNCDGCIVRDGLSFVNIPQPIYLTVRDSENTDIEKNYCYSCARNEVSKLDKEIVDC
jgi:hypothetical protein